MNACVTKPIDRIKLLDTINQVIGEEVHVPVKPRRVDPQAPPANAVAGAAGMECAVSGDVRDLLRQMNAIASGA